MTDASDERMPDLDHRILDALFKRVQANDHEAFNRFYELVSRRLLAYCFSFTSDNDTAHDLLQTAMISVYEHRIKFSEGNLLGWIFTITRNACRNWEAAEKRFEPIPASYEAVDELEDLHHKADSIYEAVLSLPREHRHVVLMHYYGGMTVKEIGIQEDISVSLVKVRLFRARKHLTELLHSLRDVHHEID